VELLKMVNDSIASEDGMKSSDVVDVFNAIKGPAMEAFDAKVAAGIIKMTKPRTFS